MKSVLEIREVGSIKEWFQEHRFHKKFPLTICFKNRSEFVLVVDITCGYSVIIDKISNIEKMDELYERTD